MNSITTDPRFLEIISDFTTNLVSDHFFKISYPSIKENSTNLLDQGVEVTISPLNKSYLYSRKTISYNRVSLIALPDISLKWRGEGLVHDLMKRDFIPNLKLFELPPNRNGVRGRVRFLKPLVRDIINDPIVPTTNRTKLILRAHPESFFFFGEKEITIIRDE